MLTELVTRPLMLKDLFCKSRREADMPFWPRLQLLSLLQVTPIWSEILELTVLSLLMYECLAVSIDFDCVSLRLTFLVTDMIPWPLLWESDFWLILSSLEWAIYILLFNSLKKPAMSNDNDWFIGELVSIDSERTFLQNRIRIWLDIFNHRIRKTNILPSLCSATKLEWQQRLGEWQENPTDNLLSATDWPNSSLPWQPNTHIFNKNKNHTVWQGS